ncbi:lanthionine synthetase C family protein [Natronosporangium hydrolyticum]|uniref:Lanthionine synthetase C family protein n=1 Tax=Natronosporangium hydrolyticum TaxID=2811111 RepID=A0A895YE89_9ACTN|nr:lanthionine synthetase C family protein [Natronosporangium hydrolyticum]QSB12856.1 lanthionine synthetase C family protein [Natronosporangium hydrolyticum]
MTPPNPAALAAAEQVADAFAQPRHVRYLTTSGRARPQSLAGGAVGIALLHLERLCSGHGDETTAHTWLSHAAAEPVSAGDNANLFHGAPALAFALHVAAALSGRYHRTLAALDDKTIAITRGRLAAARSRINRGDRLPMREFDLVHGLTGLGAYHLAQHPDHPVTREVLTYLVRITQPSATARKPGGDDLPAWWLASGLNGNPDPQAYPQGHGNLGVAHGISAVVALLSLAILRGLPVPGARQALADLCGWIDRWCQDSETAPWWPGFVTTSQVHGSQPPARPRPSWCYGIAGTARAQQLAGMAMADTTRQHLAEAAMLATLRDPHQLAQLPEIGLCHGKAGLLQAGWRMAADAEDPHLATTLGSLTDELITQLSGQVDDPDLMDGTTGAALALHTIGTGTGPSSGWDTFLLLT